MRTRIVTAGLAALALLAGAVASPAGAQQITTLYYQEVEKDGRVYVFNTPEDGRARKDSYALRRTAVTQSIPYYLTVDGAQAAIGAIEALLKGEPGVASLQEYHADA